MMRAALDVHYRTDGLASAAAVCFQHWNDPVPAQVMVRLMPTPADYRPGAFYRRELPCLLALIREMDSPPDLLLIDGYVTLGPRAGLGRHLYRALDAVLPVIGVAKSPYPGAVGIAVHRGSSRRPLYVTAAGISLLTACGALRRMHGDHRTPTLLRMADRLSKRGPV
ncbi:MAG: endonuclease V [Desulfosarcinaceae bacterium]|nr:endonuclease V [Desulfosarcinaceae bacterium]